MRRRSACLAGCLLAVTAAGISRAEDLPLWEVGIGFTGLGLPDYRGSDQQRFYVLPMPYLVYRGDFLRLDSNGLSGRIFHTDRLHLNLSADAAVPVQNTQNRALADLDPTVQLGPSLEYCLFQDPKAERVLQLCLPVRAVIATDLSRWRGIGFVAHPELTFDWKNTGPGGGWNFGLAVGPLFATEPYHDYYYEVAPRFAVPDFRPAYDARAGYSGSVLILSVTKRFGHFWFGGFARYDELAGAVFVHSPLMRTEHSWMAGFGFAWVFWESKTLVPASR